MRKEPLLCRLERGFKPTTGSSRSPKTYPNPTKDTAVGAPERAWSAGITYVVRLPTSFR
jgi:hypothetical protein